MIESRMIKLALIFCLFIRCFIGFTREASAQSLPTVNDILIYQISSDCADALKDQIVARCQARSIAVTRDDSGPLVSRRFVDYKEAQLLRNMFLRMGLSAKTQISFTSYDELLRNNEFPREEYATFTDLMPAPITLPAIDTFSVYQKFQQISNSSNVTRQERIQAIAPFVDALRFRSDDAHAQYLSGMYHYMLGQELQAQYDMTITNNQTIPLANDMYRHFFTGYRHFRQAALLRGPLQEESLYESAMVSQGLKYQGDATYRLLQGIQEFSNYLNIYLQGTHSIRISLHRKEYMRDIVTMGSDHLSDHLRNFYVDYVVDEAERLVQDSRISRDPSIYEHVLAVILYSEVIYTLGDKSKIQPLYQERYGNWRPGDLPASTYWMFAILWHVNMLAAEDLSDWGNALRFSEYRLAAPPTNGNAWPQGDPESNKRQVLGKAIEYATKLGDSQKCAELDAQLKALSY